MRAGNWVSKRQEKWWLVGLLLLAFGLRVVALDEAPPGLRYDELQNYLMAGRVVAGERPLYFAESWGHEPLYHYLQAGSLALLGESDWSLRLPSVILGMVELAATWLVAKKLLGRKVGLLALTFLTLSFWAIFYSRVGLRVGGVTAFSSLMVYFLWRLWERPTAEKWPGLVDGVLAGLFMAAGVYTYLSGRVLPAIFVGFVLFTAVFHRQKLKERWLRLALTALVAGVLCWPLWQAIQANPTGEQRLELLNQAIVALEQGNPLPILELTVKALGMYVITGERDWLYNEYGRPVFTAAAAVFFVFGLFWVLWRWRQPGNALMLLWFFGGTGPAMIAPPPASVTHSIVAQPVTYILLGIGLAQFLRLLDKRRRLAAVLLGLLVIGSGIEAGMAYFGTWNRQPEVGELYQAGITAAADAVQIDQPPGPVLVGGPFINYWQPWNAVNFELASTGDVSQVRWFNPAGAWVWPASPSRASYYFPKAPLAPQQYDPALLALFQADAVPEATGDNDYEKFTLAGWPAFEEQLSQTMAETAVSWPPDLSHLPPPQLPLTFGDHIQLLAVSVPEETADNAVRFLTYWEVLTADPTPLVAFVHLTSDGFDIWGQQDWLDVRQAGLQPGDRFVQVHSVPINPGAPVGDYWLQLGLYEPETRNRLLITSVEGLVADRVLAASISLNN